MQTVRSGILLWIPLLFSLVAFAPAPSDNKLWMSLDDAAQLLKNEKRPVLIDLYTDWCGWCRVMDQKTYSHKSVIDYLGKKYYAVKLNAESRQSIAWGGKVYNFNEGYKANDFAIFLTGGRLAYPTTVIMPADGTDPQAIAGYLETAEFEKVVKYFGEGHYRKTPYEEYQKAFKGSWK